MEKCPIKCFVKSEAVQSKAPLKDMNIRVVNVPMPDLDKINLNQTAKHDDELVETPMDVDESQAVEEEEPLPEPPLTAAEFFSGYINLKDEPTRFGRYFMVGGCRCFQSQLSVDLSLPIRVHFRRPDGL